MNEAHSILNDRRNDCHNEYFIENLKKGFHRIRSYASHSGIFSRGAQFLNDSMVHADSSGLVHRRNLTKVLK